MTDAQKQLNPLQIEAAKALAAGTTPKQVRTELDLTQEVFIAWRSSEPFVQAVAEFRAELAAAAVATTKQEKAADADRNPEEETAFSYPKDQA